MADRIEPIPQDRKAWLLEIARRLRADYEALLEPVPPRYRFPTGCSHTVPPPVGRADGRDFRDRSVPIPIQKNSGLPKGLLGIFAAVYTRKVAAYAFLR
jgi:hypothetical protein